ncbi:MAG: hypothetical protein J6Z20_05900 [Bacteroidales bacterium]|nr:hypothetical protein [Bacteroidales bacterium]
MEGAELRLTHITRYEDVERGQLILTVGDKRKCWKATWQTDLHLEVNGSRHLPRGTLPLYLNRARAPWGTCPRLKLNHRSSMWLEPLDAANWSDFGIDLYLCEADDYLKPLNKADYVLMVLALEHYNIREIIIDEPNVIKPVNKYQHGFEAEFWRNENN